MLMRRSRKSQGRAVGCVQGPRAKLHSLFHAINMPIGLTLVAVEGFRVQADRGGGGKGQITASGCVQEPKTKLHSIFKAVDMLISYSTYNPPSLQVGFMSRSPMPPPPVWRPWCRWSTRTQATSPWASPMAT